MQIGKAKELDIVDYLSRLGFKPERISGNSYWYLSPLHDENTASFKVNTNINRWYDYALKQGGNLVDFGIAYHRCDVSDFLQKLDGPGASIAREQFKPFAQHVKPEGGEDKKIEILSVHSITSWPLIKYYRERMIADDIADKFLQEARYKIGEKTFYGLAFKNDAGGYELRNRHMKSASTPKDTTFMDNGAKDAAVFEGFFNFLSYRTLHHKQVDPPRNYLILNTASFFEKSLPLLQKHEHAHLFLDNDNTGEKFTKLALNLDKQKFIDERGLYKHHNDLNDWHRHFGKPPAHRLHL